MPRSFRPIGAVTISLLVLTIVACGAPADTPSSTPTPTLPPGPTAEPWTGRDDVDDTAVRDAFLASLGASERSCVENAVDQEGLLRITGQVLDQTADRPQTGAYEGDTVGSCLGKMPEESLGPEFLRALVEVMPGVPAPHGISTLEWPSDAGEIEGLMERAAEATGGRLEDSGEQLRVAIGATDSSHALQAMSWGQFEPGDPTASQGLIILAFALGADWDVLAAAKDGNLVWVRWATTGNGERFESLMWGEPGNTWTFAATGPTREEVDAAAQALVGALATE